MCDCIIMLTKILHNTQNFKNLTFLYNWPKIKLPINEKWSMKYAMTITELLTFDNSLFNWPGTSAPTLRQILQNILCRFRLSSTRLTTHNNRLAFFQNLHVAISLVGCKQRQYCHLLYTYPIIKIVIIHIS